MGDRSRRVHYSQKRTRRPKGGTDVYGEREDQGKYVRCGYCGFINSLDRTDRGGPTALSGVSPAYFEDPYEIFTDPSVTPATALLSLECGGIQDIPVPVMPPSVSFRLNFKPVVGRFCAFCGSPNWYK